MKMSDGEKLIVLMLTELYESLGINGEIDPEFIRSSIFSDEIWGIPFKYHGIRFDSDQLPPLATEVFDILDLWRLIETSYERLSDSDKSILGENVHNFCVPPKFPGFDGNHESDYMGTAHYIVEHLERFEEFKGRIPNTHTRIVGRYKQMISMLTGIRAKNDYGLLSVDELAELLNLLSA